jgi:hypothetical protein
VPGRAELAAAADIRQHIGPALFQPEPAGHGAVGRVHRHLETAIGIEQGRRGPIHRDVFPRDEEIRHLGSVPGGREVLLDFQARRIELGRHAFQQRRRIARGVVFKQ